MQTVLVKYKILDEDAWRAWCQQIMAREDEARQTLIDEGVAFEGCWQLEGFVYGVMVAEDLEAAMQTFNESERELDKEHAQKLDACLERVAVGEELYALQGQA